MEARKVENGYGKVVLHEMLDLWRFPNVHRGKVVKIGTYFRRTRRT